jgi:hypothetical protein
MRRSALRPLGLSGGQEKAPPGGAGDYGVPGAAKNTGDDVCLIVIPGPVLRTVPE